MRKINFEERSIAKAGKNLFILSLLVIILCFSACIGTAEETVYPSGPRERPSHFPGIEGPWYINAGGSPGKLEFYRDRNAWRARVWFDYRNEWEELIGIFFDPRTNRLEFTRPNEDQRYSGTVRGEQITGTYTSSGTMTRQWEARREGLMDLRQVEGPWYINAGGSPGRIEFYRDRHTWGARVWFDYKGEWEELIGIFFDPRTGRLEFTRPSEDQRYSGTVRGERITGTYTSSNTATRPWDARRY